MSQDGYTPYRCRMTTGGYVPPEIEKQLKAEMMERYRAELESLKKKKEAKWCTNPVQPIETPVQTLVQPVQNEIDPNELEIYDDILDQTFEEEQTPELPPNEFFKLLNFKQEKKLNPMQFRKLYRMRKNKKKSFQEIADILKIQKVDCEEHFNTINNILRFFE